jgi:AraC family transcriptional regulator, ethanolamine operon transcriptional activator
MATITTAHLNDADDQARSLNGFRQMYEQLGRGRFSGRVWQLMLNEGLLLREATNRSLRQHFSPPPEHVAIAVPLAVQPGSVFGGRPLQRESLLVLSDREEYDLVSAGELDVIGLAVHRDVIGQLAPAKLEWLRRAEAERNLPLTPEVAAAIRQMLLAVSNDAEGRLTALHDAAAELELLSSTLTQTVVLAMSSSRSDHTIPRRADSRMKVVRRAIAFMRDRLHDEVGIPELCAAACASRRTLQYCFEEFLHTTPQAYLRALRLNEARRMLKSRADQPITELASDLGFASASHFTRHYKLMFDELPSETLKGGADGGQVPVMAAP